jgi:hypothetical protein
MWIHVVFNTLQDKMVANNALDDVTKFKEVSLKLQQQITKKLWDAQIQICCIQM